MEKFLFFDVETNGLPKNYKADLTEFDNWPRVVQLAFALYDISGALIYETCHMIKPDNWEIPNEEFFIRNNLTTERCQKEGEVIDKVLEKFIAAISDADLLVAHNLNFDHKIISVEMLRKELAAEKKPKFCTMIGTVEYCQMPGKYGLKWPKLEELYMKVFSEPMTNSHDALGDITATAKCFFELYKNDLITIK